MGGKHGKHSGTNDPRGDAYYGSNGGYNTSTGKHDKHDKHNKNSGYDQHVASGSNVTPNAYGGYTETRTDVYAGGQQNTGNGKHRVTPTEEIHIANRDQMHPELVSMVPVGPMADLRVSEEQNRAKVVTTQTTYLESPVTTTYQQGYQQNYPQQGYQQQGVYPVVTDTTHGHHNKHHDKHANDYNNTNTTGYTNTVPLVVPVTTGNYNNNLASNTNTYPNNNANLLSNTNSYTNTTPTTGQRITQEVHHIETTAYNDTIGRVENHGAYQSTTANAYLNQNHTNANNLANHDIAHTVPTVTNPNFPIDPNVNPNFPANPQTYTNALDQRENHPTI